MHMWWGYIRKTYGQKITLSGTNLNDVINDQAYDFIVVYFIK
jgi:hypothetical protein